MGLLGGNSLAGRESLWINRMLLPFHVFGIWLRGLFAIALLAGGIYLLTQWNDERKTVVIQSHASEVEPVSPPERLPEHRKMITWQLGLNPGTAFLVGGILLLSWSLFGGWMASVRLLRRTGDDEPKGALVGKSHFLTMPDGRKVHVKISGPDKGTPLVLTHGWGLTSREWYYLQRDLSKRYRIVSWDLPGLGKSQSPADNDWSLEKLSAALDLVIEKAGPRPVVLVGHSIGVMITLTYCRLFLDALGPKVCALVLAQGTYTNPVKTTAMATLYTALQKPLLEPLCHLMILLSPLFRILNWLSYFNGSALNSTERGSFSGSESRGKLEFITRQYCAASPYVVGKGMLAMLRYDATNVLTNIPVPTLIVAGDRDRICLPAASQFMKQAIPRSSLEILKNSKHCGLFEHHKSFQNAVTEFVESLTKPELDHADQSLEPHLFEKHVRTRRSPDE